MLHCAHLQDAIDVSLSAARQHYNKGDNTMYELYEGSRRLAQAMYAVQNDDCIVNALARLLYYVPEQLREDMQALHDIMNGQTRPVGGEHHDRF